jgi:hypothetical protein
MATKGSSTQARTLTSPRETSSSHSGGPGRGWDSWLPINVADVPIAIRCDTELMAIRHGGGSPHPPPVTIASKINKSRV